jgi:hypothetical protein
VFSSLYWVALPLLKGFRSSVYLWTGAVVLAGLAGWLLGYPTPPPEEPREEHGY